MYVRQEPGGRGGCATHSSDEREKAVCRRETPADQRREASPEIDNVSDSPVSARLETLYFSNRPCLRPDAIPEDGGGERFQRDLHQYVALSPPSTQSAWPVI